jgi:hypothetical protein
MQILRAFYQIYTYNRTEYGKLGADFPLKYLHMLRNSQPSPTLFKAQRQSFLTNTSTNHVISIPIKESYRKIPKE